MLKIIQLEDAKFKEIVDDLIKRGVIKEDSKEFMKF